MRPAAARTQSINNLKQIGLGAQSFHDFHKRLPFNGTRAAVANDPASGSWAFQILPFIDQAPLFAQPNLNAGVASYMCPGRGRPTFCATGAWTDYMINPWLNDARNGAVNAADVKRELKDITDGTSNTIFAGHGMINPSLYPSITAHAQSTDIFKGGEPALARRSTTNQRDTNDDAGLTWGSPFAQGTLVVFCDGTVRMIPYSMTGGTIVDGVSKGPANNPVQLGDPVGRFGAYLTPAGGEAVVLPD